MICSIAAIKANGGRHLQNFKEKSITFDISLAAVELDGTALVFVPERFRTTEISEAAVAKTGKMTVTNHDGQFLRYEWGSVIPTPMDSSQKRHLCGVHRDVAVN